MARCAASATALLLSAAAVAQQPAPLLNRPEPLPPPAQSTPLAAPPAAAPPAQPAAPAEPIGRVFCGQNVTYRLADPETISPPYRPFIGIWSDAAWTTQLCAALIVESIAPDGTATITYAFGPIGAGNAKSGGVLHGTGVIEDGELKFQNSDGSQYAFKPFYSDLSGHWTAPKGDNYEAVFKKTL